MTAITKGSRNDRWLAAMMNGPVAGMCSRPIRLNRQYRWKNGCRIARSPQYTSGLTPRPRARSSSASRSMPWIRAIGGRGYSSPMAIDRARTARGALAGVIAAGAWSVQAQLDTRAFGGAYSAEGPRAPWAVGGPLPRRGAARQGRDPRPGVAGGRLRAAPAQRRRLRRRLPEHRPSAAPAPVGARTGSRDDRAPHDVAGNGRRRPRAPGPQRAPGPVGQRPRLRPGHLAPPGLRHRPRRARAPLQRARRHRRASLRAGRLLQRPRRHRACRGRFRDLVDPDARYPRLDPAGVAQLVEHRSCKAGVTGSSPVSGSPQRLRTFTTFDPPARYG